MPGEAVAAISVDRRHTLAQPAIIEPIKPTVRINVADNLICRIKLHRDALNSSFKGSVNQSTDASCGAKSEILSKSRWKYARLMSL
jgi:hypothetical protein